MNSITWLELYNFLHKQANDINNVGKFEWNKQVMIHNAETGDEYTCDTWEITDSNGRDRCVMMINIEEIFRDNNGSRTTK